MFRRIFGYDLLSGLITTIAVNSISRRDKIYTIYIRIFDNNHFFPLKNRSVLHRKVSWQSSFLNLIYQLLSSTSTFTFCHNKPSNYKPPIQRTFLHHIGGLYKFWNSPERYFLRQKMTSDEATTEERFPSGPAATLYLDLTSLTRVFHTDFQHIELQLHWYQIYIIIKCSIAHAALNDFLAKGIQFRCNKLC